MHTTIRGKVWKFGDNISGDNGIIEFGMVRDYTKPYDEKELARSCFARIDPSFAPNVRPGDVVVGGRNFAHHNHPQVAVAIKASGIAAVIVESTETNFLRKSLNVGLPVVMCPGVTSIVAAGDTLEVDLATGLVRNAATGAALKARPFSDQMLGIWAAGGLVPYLTAQVAASRRSA